MNRWWSVFCLIIFVNYPEDYNKPYRQDKALTCIRTSNEAMCLLRKTMIKSRFVSWCCRAKSSTQKQTKLYSLSNTHPFTYLSHSFEHAVTPALHAPTYSFVLVVVKEGFHESHTATYTVVVVACEQELASSV